MRTKRAAVIGGGFGGLTLAVRLQAAGIDTTVIEKRDKLGGRAYVYEDKGYAFDGGPTIITAPPSLEEVFAAAGRDMADHVTLMPVMPFYRLYWEDGFSFDYSNDMEAITAQIAAKSPGDVAGYRRFLDYAEDVFHEGYTKLAAAPFLDFWSMIRVSPQLIR
ncbi:MAG TPA: NAD(P)-binding protein, partial [Candidatus Sulfomarinibacteraceae bacterium]|nr:NAD(P)-binding protein [Candidatus Sulfomarinibacteraceae bacterium]